MTVTVYLSDNSLDIDILDDDDMEARFDDMVLEVYGTVDILGITFDAGPALKSLDPIAYRQNFLDWLDSDEDTVEAEMPWELYVSQDEAARQEWAAAQL